MAARQDVQVALLVWETGPLVSEVASVGPRAVWKESAGPEAEWASLVDHQVS